MTRLTLVVRSSCERLLKNFVHAVLEFIESNSGKRFCGNLSTCKLSRPSELMVEGLDL